MKLSSFTAVLAVCFLIGCNDGTDDDGLGLSTDVGHLFGVRAIYTPSKPMQNYDIGIGTPGTAQYLTTTTDSDGSSEFIEVPTVPALVPVWFPQHAVTDTDFGTGNAVGQQYDVSMTSSTVTGDDKLFLTFFHRIPIAWDYTIASYDTLHGGEDVDRRWFLSSDSSASFSDVPAQMAYLVGTSEIDAYARFLSVPLPENVVHAAFLIRTDSAASFGSDTLVLSLDTAGLDLTEDPDILTACVGSATSTLEASFTDWETIGGRASGGGSTTGGMTNMTPQRRVTFANIELSNGLCAGSNLVLLKAATNSRSASEIPAIFADVQHVDPDHFRPDPSRRVPIGSLMHCEPEAPACSGSSDCVPKPDCDNKYEITSGCDLLKGAGFCLGPDDTVSTSDCIQGCMTLEIGAEIPGFSVKEQIQQCKQRCEEKSYGNSSDQIKCRRHYKIVNWNQQKSWHEAKWFDTYIGNCWHIDDCSTVLTDVPQCLAEGVGGGG